MGKKDVPKGRYFTAKQIYQALPYLSPIIEELVPLFHRAHLLRQSVLGLEAIRDGTGKADPRIPGMWEVVKRNEDRCLELFVELDKFGVHCTDFDNNRLCFLADPASYQGKVESGQVVLVSLSFRQILGLRS